MRGEGYLHIKYLPKNTVTEMIEYLNNTDEFGGQWSTGMKYIWDTFKGTLPPKDEQILAELSVLHKRIDELESQITTNASPKSPEKGRRMADGSMREK